MTETIGVGVIGMGWMGTVHSRAYRNITERFRGVGISVVMVICADEVKARADDGQKHFGFLRSTTDWRDVTADPDVDVVVIAASNNSHLEIVQQAAAAGKHIFCEKPVGRNPEETIASQKAASQAKILTAVGYNYRWAPVIRYAQQLIRDGKLGEITHYRSRFLVDYGSNPDGVLSWRFQQELSGWGTLGDLMSHVIDMAHMLVGPIERVVSQQKQFISQRPLAAPGEGTHFSVAGGGPKAPVTNEDYVAALAQFTNGAPATFEVCRVVKGHDCEMALEVNGTQGALKWNYERLNELELRLSDNQDVHEGFTLLRAGPQHPQFADFYPGIGNSMGYEDLKLIEAYQFVKSIVDGQQGQPGFDEALAVAAVQVAMSRSWHSERWEPVNKETPAP